MIFRNRTGWGLRLRRNLILVASMLVVLVGVWPAGQTDAAPSTPTSTNCSYVLGFATLRSLVEGSQGAGKVGACLEGEYHALNGDGLQWTTGGLLIWRKATNWTGFTDGQSTWVNGPHGLEKRSNGELLSWEPAQYPDAVAFLTGTTGALPQPIEMEEAVRQTLVLHQANDGATFNMYFGDLSGRNLYAVSLYPDRSVLVEGKQIPIDLLRRFVADNRDLWQDPRVSVGTWYRCIGLSSGAGSGCLERAFRCL